MKQYIQLITGLSHFHFKCKFKKTVKLAHRQINASRNDLFGRDKKDDTVVSSVGDDSM